MLDSSLSYPTQQKKEAGQGVVLSVDSKAERLESLSIKEGM